MSLSVETYSSWRIHRLAFKTETTTVWRDTPSISVLLCCEVISLLWLDHANDVRLHVFFWTALFHQAAQNILADLITPSAAVTARPGLRSAASSSVAVPRTKSSLGDRSFAAAGPRAWNKLPPPLRCVSSPAAFKRQLKTFYTITLLIHIVRRPCVSALTSP